MALTREAKAVAIEEVRQLARRWAPDYYLSALLSPRPARPDLVTLAAFFGDIERILATIGDPMLADIRLRWWGDTLAAGAMTGHPVADALLDVMHRRALPPAVPADILEARSFDLFADSLPDEAALMAYLAKADGGTFRLVSQVLAAVEPPPEAGQAYGLARLMCQTARFIARGRSPFPGPSIETLSVRSSFMEALAGRRGMARERVASVRVFLSQQGVRNATALLPVALVEPYLQALEEPGFEPARMIADVEPLTRAWRLWQARLLRRI